MKYKHLFGPVPSRRLGLSLGVDLVPYKTCTLNCVYCECGETTNLTTARIEYVPARSVIAELDDYLSTAPSLDYVTFSGSGEPTLNSALGSIADFIKNSYPRYRTCLLTNGTLFTDAAVRRAVSRIDMIVPSLDAAGEDAFKQINRPHKSISCAAVIDGLAALRSDYRGEIVLEIFIVPGINNQPAELALLKEATGRIKPDRIQIGTLDRPGTEDWVEAAGEKTMQKIACFLGEAELIGDFRPRRADTALHKAQSDQIIRTLQRRPCTIKDLQQALNLRPVEIQKQVNLLRKQGKIEAEKKSRGIFFRAK